MITMQPSLCFGSAAYMGESSARIKTSFVKSFKQKLKSGTYEEIESALAQLSMVLRQENRWPEACVSIEDRGV
jgi:hypothetical protein